MDSGDTEPLDEDQVLAALAEAARLRQHPILRPTAQGPDACVVTDGGRLPAALLDDGRLEASSVVANCSMNRERQLTGVNSYQRELGFDPVDVLTARIDRRDTSGRVGPQVGWLDLCCGSGRALVQAVARLRAAGLDGEVAVVGVDLVSPFDNACVDGAGPTPVTCSVTAWTPDRAFDLITCVHGLHYVGDKLAVLTRAAGWLTAGGLLVADLDLTGIRLPDGRPAGRRLSTQLRAAGFAYDSRRKRITLVGHRAVELPYTYLGADDQAGANYTGQPAVRSYYRQDD